MPTSPGALRQRTLAAASAAAAVILTIALSAGCRSTGVEHRLQPAGPHDPPAAATSDSIDTIARRFRQRRGRDRWDEASNLIRLGALPATPLHSATPARQAISRRSLLWLLGQPDRVEGDSMVYLLSAGSSATVRELIITLQNHRVVHVVRASYY